MQTLAQDRRQHRSVQLEEATRLQLARVAGEFDLGLCAVSDQDGRLVACAAAAPQEGELVALLGALQDRARFGDTIARHAERTLIDQLKRRGVAVVGQGRVTVREFHAAGHRLYLTALGEPGTMLEVGIYRAILGIRRIWQQSAQVAA
jgi:hypothetical protein